MAGAGLEVVDWAASSEMTWSSRASTGRPRARIGLAEMQGSEGGLIDGYALLKLNRWLKELATGVFS